MLRTVCPFDFRRACPSGITTGRLQQAQRVGRLSFGLAPMEAATGPLILQTPAFELNSGLLSGDMKRIETR